MNDFKKQFSHLTSEYLFQLRARGDELSDDAHHAIEEIFTERGERLPARPKTSIFIADSHTPANGAGKLFSSTGLIIITLIGMGVANALTHTWIGVFITIGVVIFFITNWLRRQNLTPAERAREDDKNKAEKEGLTEIMVCAASGNLERIRELVEYGGDVNTKSLSGTTALMYAARNNHPAIVDFLLTAGGDPKLRSDKNSTAMDIAKKFGHLEIVERLEQQVT